MRLLQAEQLESRDVPGAFSGDGFTTDFRGVYGFVGPLQDAFGRTDGTDWHAVAGQVGNGPRVVVRDIHTGATLADFFAFEESFRGGVVMESVDRPEGTRLLVGAGPGGAPIVKQYEPTLGLRVGPTLVFGDLDRDRMGVGYLSSSGGVVYATLGEGAGPVLRGIDPESGSEKVSILIGPEDDRSGLYEPIPAGLAVRSPSYPADTLGVYVDGPDGSYKYIPFPNGD